MQYNIFILLLLLAVIGCRKDSNIIGPGTIPTLSNSKAKDGILYTFAVYKDKLGIFDTLKMSITALNQTTAPETLYVSESPSFYTWSLTNDSGRTIISGPWLGNDLINPVVINPNQSAVLYSFGYSMADIFGVPINAGSYLLKWNLSNGLSFQLNLSCGKSENEITDPSGINSPIYPLKVGNKWTFKDELILSDGTVLDNGTVTQTIVGETMIDGEKWFLLNSTAFVDQLITTRQDGIYIYYSDIKAAVLKYKYPAYQGEQYVSGYEEFLWDSDTLVTFQMTVDSTNEVVSVPGGQYTCLKYHAPQVLATYSFKTNEIDPEDMFLSNVGPVKRIFYSSNGKPYNYWELVSTNFQYVSQ
jgi:hypothetical protein